MALRNILLVDDKDDFRIVAKWFFSNFGYAVDSARSAEEALSLFNPQIHDLVITDNRMPGLTGSEMAHVIKLRSPETPVFMLTGSIPDDTSCVDVVIKKPVHLLEVKDRLEQWLAAREANKTAATRDTVGPASRA